MEASRRRLIGIALVVASAALFSVAGVFTKMISADAWTIAGWRGLIGAVLLGGYTLWQRRGATVREPLHLGWRGWFIVLNSTAASAVYILSFKYTYVTNVAVIYATAPFIAAGLAWAALGERPRLLTFVSACISLFGVLVIVSSGLQSANFFGDSLALLMTVLFATYIVATRAFRDTPIVWALAVSAFILFAFSWIVSDPLAISGRDFLICILFGFTFASAFVLLTEGAARLPVAETVLIGTLDVPFAAGFAWLLISEIPPAATIIGGAIVVAAIALQSAMETAQTRRAQLRARKAV